MPTGPQRYELKRAVTQFLRVPQHDWTAVKRGYKTEFRLAGGKADSYPRLLAVEFPTPVVAYVSRQNGMHEKIMLVLERSWVEPLGAISEESLQHEGFETIGHFRRYWTARTKMRFRPLQRVQVFRVRLYTPDDIEVLGAGLFRRLYGEFTGADSEPGVVPRRSPIPTGVR